MAETTTESSIVVSIRKSSFRTATNKIADVTAQRIPPEKTQTRRNYNSNAQQTRKNRNQKTDRFDPVEAGKIQKLYTIIKKKDI